MQIRNSHSLAIEKSRHTAVRGIERESKAFRSGPVLLIVQYPKLECHIPLKPHLTTHSRTTTVTNTTTGSVSSTDDIPSNIRTGTLNAYLGIQLLTKSMAWSTLHLYMISGTISASKNSHQVCTPSLLPGKHIVVYRCDRDSSGGESLEIAKTPCIMLDCIPYVASIKSRLGPVCGGVQQHSPGLRPFLICRGIALYWQERSETWEFPPMVRVCPVYNTP